MRSFAERIAICLIPVLVAGYIVGVAWSRYVKGEGGFKLGVDLVGGTILVYEVDVDKFPNRTPPPEYTPQALAAAIKRRIDPTDLYNVTIRPVSNTRVEIILPTGGAHQARIEEQDWKSLLDKVREHWPELKQASLGVPRGQPVELASRVQHDLAWKKMLAKVPENEKWAKLKGVDLSDIPTDNQTELLARIQKVDPSATDQELEQFVSKNTLDPTMDDVKAFINANYRAGEKRKDISAEQVKEFKRLISQVGKLEFRILANEVDDEAVFREVENWFKNPQNKATLEKKAIDGLPPPPPEPPQGETGFEMKIEPGRATYSWVELGKSERKSLRLDNAQEQNPDPNSLWNVARKAREEGVPFIDRFQQGGESAPKILLYSRKTINNKLPDSERRAKRYDYFVLVRNPDKDPSTGQSKEITGKYLVTAREDQDRSLKPSVAFKFNTQGGNLFYEVTHNNRPTDDAGSKFYRHLAIIWDDQVVSAPRLITAIQTDGQITGNFTSDEVNQLVRTLRAGALPATLKPEPVSENTIGPTLGEDTIRSGTFSVGVAFAAILIFMLVYYRFSGLVACVALLANLLLTVGFMVLVNATFTLPGLAGLVLMLGMAVDANVLIYERLREERDHGNSLAMSIRNGYDRAFPTIIDTHLSSIFTAIVLYAVGNDQLKGFGVSLTVGLIISLFTSLYMTRLMFDIWLAKGWLKKLSMFRLLSRTNIDFMKIRYAMFTATVVISVLGLAVFLLRGEAGLNIDFVGGTAYSGQLDRVTPEEASARGIAAVDRAKTVTELRNLLKDDRQGVILSVNKVDEIDKDRHVYLIRYNQDVGSPNDPQQEREVTFATAPKGDTPEERTREVKERAQTLPDWSVEQIFLSQEGSEGGKSRFFTIRTSEKEADLVQVSIDRLLREKQEDGSWTSLLKRVTLEKMDTKAKEPLLTFSDYASPEAVNALLERLFKNAGIEEQQPVQVQGVGDSSEGRYKQMRLVLSDATAKLPKENPAKFEAIMAKLRGEFNARPQPERLENFDSQLASETQSRALYAILLSWAAILLYLWFRFGNWTFGLAAVLCLLHDLCFTLGAIALCHYIHHWLPGLAHVLLIQDFKIDLPAVAALLTLVGYSVNDTIVVFDRIREVRGKNPDLTPQMINDSVNQTLSRTLLTAFSVWLVVIVLYIWGGEGVHLFAFVMVAGVIVGTYSSIYIASPLLLIFGEGARPSAVKDRRPVPEPEGAPA